MTLQYDTSSFATLSVIGYIPARSDGTIIKNKVGLNQPTLRNFRTARCLLSEGDQHGEARRY